MSIADTLPPVIIAAPGINTAPGDPVVAVILDGELAGFYRGWPLPLFSDWERRITDRFGSEWRSAALYSGATVDGQFVGRPLCGYSKGA
jgi:hypothetical protein